MVLATGKVKERGTVNSWYVSAFTWRNALRQNAQTLLSCQSTRSSVPGLSRLSLSSHTLSSQPSSTACWQPCFHSFIPRAEARGLQNGGFDKLESQLSVPMILSSFHKIC